MHMVLCIQLLCKLMCLHDYRLDREEGIFCRFIDYNLGSLKFTGKSFPPHCFLLAGEADETHCSSCVFAYKLPLYRSLSRVPCEGLSPAGVEQQSQ